MTYFKSRFFNQNTDELLRNCDLEHGIDFVSELESPTMLPFEVQNHVLNSGNVNFFGKECQTGPIPVRGFSAPKNKERSLTELLGLVFQTDDMQTKIKEGFRQKLDFNEFWQEHLRSVEGTQATPYTPSELVVTTDQSATAGPHYTPEQAEMQQISTTFDQSKGRTFTGAVSSTPLTSHVARVTRTSSQPVHRHAAQQGARSPKRAVSADRSGESLQRFADRIKTRSKPRRFRY